VPARPGTVRGRLRAVSDRSPSEPQAPARECGQITHWRLQGRYREETIAALAGLLFGEKVIERLTADQVRQFCFALEFAVRGGVAQRTLAGAITRLSKRDDRAEAAEALRIWLVQKANERELPGRQAA
jgi:hypothetical protein